jgi:hypothetical protein
MKKTVIIVLIVMSSVSFAQQIEQPRNLFQGFINNIINLQKGKIPIVKDPEEECEYFNSEKPKNRKSQNNKSQTNVEEEGTGGCPLLP